MKKLFILLACAATVVACSKDETIASFQGDAIKFGNPFVNKSTRVAADQSYNGNKDLESFNVYGNVNPDDDVATPVVIFTGDEVTGEVGANVWSCSNTQYWIVDAAYQFAAVADATSVTVDATTGLPATITYDADIDTNEFQNDLLYATANLTADANTTAVDFQFNHLLSKVKFTVDSSTEGDYKYNVKDIKINAYQDGVYTVSSGTWTPSNLDDTPFGDILAVNNTADIESDYERLLIPTTTDLDVSFTVELCKGTDVLSSTAVTKKIATDLEKGTAYNVLISLSIGNPIQFKVTQDPTGWVSAAGGDVTLQ